MSLFLYLHSFMKYQSLLPSYVVTHDYVWSLSWLDVCQSYCPCYWQCLQANVSMLFICYCLLHLCKHYYLSLCHHLIHNTVKATSIWVLAYLPRSCYHYRPLHSTFVFTFLGWHLCMLTVLHLLFMGHWSPALLFIGCAVMTCPFSQAPSGCIFWCMFLPTHLACYSFMVYSSSSVHHAGCILLMWGCSSHGIGLSLLYILSL